MIVLKANYWEHYISIMASAEEMSMSYNARINCVNTGINILNSSKTLRGFVFFLLATSPLIPLLSQRRRRRKLMFLSHMFHY